VGEVTLPPSGARLVEVEKGLTRATSVVSDDMTTRIDISIRDIRGCSICACNLFFFERISACNLWGKREIFEAQQRMWAPELAERRQPKPKLPQRCSWAAYELDQPGRFLEFFLSSFKSK
jgi:hypothetical protein